MSDLTESVCMKMRVNIYSCLLAFVLGSGVSAEIIHKVFEEKQQVTLPCPRPDREVTWSREVNGSRADILTIDGDNDKRYSDTLKRFSSLSDKSLTFNKANVSDSGTYFCNSEAVELTVIPSGTIKRNATERTSITLQCPHAVGRSGSPTWSREIAGKQQPIRHLPPTVAGTLTITEVQLGDYGLYYCDGKPAVYLNVTKGTSPRLQPTTAATTIPPPTPPRTTTTATTLAPPTSPQTTATAAPVTTLPSTPQGDTDSSYLWQMSVRTVFGILFLIIMISIIVTTWRKAEQIQRQKKTEHDVTS